jgi:Diadenosine tetraphosphate (Ap4A) hydrolase and other HIT family hydrolases
VILNSFPYNPGHLMVAPFRHVGDFGAIEPAEFAEVDALLTRSVRALEEEMEPQASTSG